jgi:glycosyltransferase involved in cell wall biosynthesis
VRILCNRKHYPLYDNDTIVRALAQLRDDGLDFECRFAGTGPSLEATRLLARDLGLEEKVRFLGDLEPAEVPDLLRWADVFVSAARSDGAPSSLFEAMSAGVFPVVTDVRANRDWLESEQTGFLCRFGRAEDWARGIRFAWENPEIRSRAAAVNRARVRRDCDRKSGLLALEELLARAVRIHRGEA